MLTRVANLGESILANMATGGKRETVNDRDLSDFLDGERAAPTLVLFAGEKGSFIERSNSQ